MDQLQEKLTHLFPHQFRYLNRKEFAYSLPHGWRALFSQLCYDVNTQLSPEEKDIFQWIQIKEKFGTLRAYRDFGERGLDTEAILIDPSPGQYKRLKEVDQETRDRITTLVEAASELSGRTCVFCGEPGEMRTDQGWVHPTCAAHINSAWRDIPDQD